MKKKLYILLILIFFVNFSNAQHKQLWATGAYHGALGYGTILKADSTGNNFVPVASFNQVNGSYPNGHMVMYNNGLMYGVTRRGGISDSCTIFSFDTLTNTITKLYDFMSAPEYGDIPYGGLLLGSDCKLYGLASGGGANSKGTLYSFDPLTNVYTDIYDFVDSTGRLPQSELIQLGDGKMYGTASQGGQNGNGVIFSFDPVTNTYIDIYNFNLLTGSSPNYCTFVYANGKLYGSTRMGGPGSGVLYSFELSTSSYTVLHNFDFTAGNYPGSPMLAGNGKLYGLTFSGGATGDGVLYSYDLVADTFIVEMEFNGLNGSKPWRGLTQVSNGKLYGTASKGGIHGYGVLFNFDYTTNTYTKIIDFDSTNTGSYPDCDIYETGEEVLCTPVAVHALSNPFNISVYPNPADNYLRIEFNANEKNVSLELFNVFGEMILKKSLTNTSSGELNTRNIASGIYFLKLYCQEKEFVRKFIIRHN